jgi:hypothetical protein
MKTNRGLTSGRIPVVPPTEVSDDRYEFLLPGEAEPNLGTAPAGSVLTTNTQGQRIWASNINLGNVVSSSTTTGNVFTDNLFYANGSPYVTNSNIYNGRVTVADDLVVADYVPVAGTTTVRWLLTAKDNVNNRYKFSTIDCVNDGTTAFFTEYAVLLSNNNYEVANYASDVTTGNIDLLAQGDSSSVTITYQRTTLGSATQVGYILQ